MNKAVAYFLVCAGLFLLALPLPRTALAWPDDPPLGVALCTATGNQLWPTHTSTITSDSTGGAIVTWEDNRSGNSDIYAQRISADGTPLLRGVTLFDGDRVTHFEGRQ